MTQGSDSFSPGAALVVGGSGGLGQAICAALAEAGSDVALTYNRNEAAARETADAVEAVGRQAAVRQLSLEDDEAVAACVAAVAGAFGAIHTVVYASAPGQTHVDQGYAIDVSPAEWRALMNADTNGFFTLARASLPHLRESRGAIVALSTTAVRRTIKRNVASAVPKAGVEALVRAIAKEEGRYGVRANCVAPGMIDTPLAERIFAGLPDGAREGWLREIALRRLGAAQEIADAVLFLASPRAAYISGQVLTVDGGYGI